MRGDRLLSILLLLQVHRRLTAKEIARRLEVSERTIYRDMDALSAAGVPVYAERGSGGGWALLERYRTDLTGLSEQEALSLFVSGQTRLLADLGLNKASEAALIKLLAAIPSAYQRGAELARQRIHVDPAGWFQSEESTEHLRTIQDAVWQERRLRLTYQRTDDSVVERVVAPLGLVAKASVWYLVASVDGEPRTYRVSRVRGAELLEERSERPRGFDLAEFWRWSSSSLGERLRQYPVTLRARPDALEEARNVGRYAKLERELPPDEEGWSPMLVQFERAHEAMQYALRLGPEIEVTEPGELREMILERLRAMLVTYERSPTGRDAD